MSKPGLYREASHSGSWYSASGNCQYSSVGVSMLYASCVIFVCFYFVFPIVIVSCGCFKPSGSVQSSCPQTQTHKNRDLLQETDITGASTLPRIDVKSLLSWLTFGSCWQPHLVIPFGSRWKVSAVPLCEWLKTRQVFPFLTVIYEVCIC